MNEERLFYEGKKLETFQRFRHNGDSVELAPYLPDDNLKKAVQLAQVLERPLLVKGEPGSGKTRLAEAVAFELFGESYRDFYFEWHIKSGSKAQDGLYIINYLQRLRDANLKEGRKNSLDIMLRTGMDKGRYVELGPLGKVFRATSLAPELPPPVLLIDEIDKADIDFPNDLLQELDRMEFQIPETVNERGRPVSISAEKGRKPLIIITSNEEKALPAAFLRRCLFHYIQFPSPKELGAIIEARWPDMNKKFIGNATDVFSELHKAIGTSGTSIKNISTSELVDWITLLNFYHPDADETLNINEIPYEQALAKDIETMQVFLKFRKQLAEPATAVK
jgi:MoxR-like ATPase